MQQKTTRLCPNDRAILSAYASQRLTDSIHSIEQSTAMIGQRRTISVILQEQKKNLLTGNSSIL